MFRSLLQSAFARVERALWPPVCVFCRSSHVPDGGHLCPGCRGDLPLSPRSCRSCALPLDEAGPVCAVCLDRQTPVERVHAAFRYAFPVDAAVRAVKFAHRLEYLPVLAEGMRVLVPGACDLLVPVPLARRRHARRGFNQAVELARCLDSPLPIANNVLRTRHTPPQTGLDAAGRRQNVRGAFDVRGTLAGSYPLIVDDVMTTGATVFELARCLKRHGAERVAVLVAARRAL